MSDDFYTELQTNFCNESLNLIERFKSVILTTKQPTEEEINELSRIAHTLKGGAAIVGLQEISDYIKQVEIFVNQLRKGTIPYSNAAAIILLEFANLIKTELKEKQAGVQNDWNTVGNLLNITEYRLSVLKIKKNQIDKMIIKAPTYIKSN